MPRLEQNLERRLVRRGMARQGDEASYGGSYFQQPSPPLPPPHAPPPPLPLHHLIAAAPPMPIHCLVDDFWRLQGSYPAIWRQDSWGLGSWVGYSPRLVRGSLSWMPHSSSEHAR